MYVSHKSRRLHGVLKAKILKICEVQNFQAQYWSPQRITSQPTYTPLKTNMSPENQWLEDVFPTEIVPF